MTTCPKIEKATVVNNKGCNVCDWSGLFDPIPDFEIAGVSAVFNVFG